MSKLRFKKFLIITLVFCIVVIVGSTTVYFYSKRSCSSISSCLVLAKKGNPRSASLLGSLYLKKQGREKTPDDSYNLSQAYHWFRKAAYAGNSNAQYQMGLYYLGSALNKGACISFFRNISSVLTVSAVRSFKKTLEKRGISIADPTICDSSSLRNVFINIMEVYAFEYFKLSAEQGNVKAQNFLGTMYLNATGIKQDHLKAVGWFVRAANAGNSQAAVNLAKMYAQGEYFDRNYEEALKWAKMAADKNNVHALTFIGSLYYAGRGVPKDFEQAFAYFKKAAKRGDSGAQIAAGCMLYLGQYGDKTQQNLIEAYAWLNIGLSQDESVSQSIFGMRDHLYTGFSSEDKEKANALSGLYWKKYVLPFK